MSKEEERYGITDAHYLCDSAIFDTETDEILRLYQICDLLNQQEQELKEKDDENERLKEQLATATMYHGCDILIAELQQQLKDNTKQVCEKSKIALRKQVRKMNDSEHCYPLSAVYWQDIVAILDQIEKEEI